MEVNAEKSYVCRPSKLKYLGYSFYFEDRKKLWLPKPHDTSVGEFRAKLKELCRRNWSVSIDYRFKKLNEVIRGWINYFRLGVMKAKLEGIDAHLRMMIKIIIWKQWKVPSKRQWGLQKLGINKDLARVTAYVGVPVCRIENMRKQGPLEADSNETGTDLLCRLLYGEKPLRDIILKLNRVVPTGMLCGVRGGL